MLDSRWSAWFDGLQMTSDQRGHTVIAGPVTDQAALHGLLAKVRDLGLELLEIRRTDPFWHPTCRPAMQQLRPAGTSVDPPHQHLRSCQARTRRPTGGGAAWTPHAAAAGPTAAVRRARSQP